MSLADTSTAAPGSGAPGATPRDATGTLAGRTGLRTDNTILPRRRTPLTQPSVVPGRIPPDPRREPRGRTARANTRTASTPRRTTEHARRDV